MKLSMMPPLLMLLLSAAVLAASADSGKPNAVTVDQHHRLIVNGAPFFPITLSPGPPLNAKAPDGRDALDVVKEGGVNMLRLGLFDKREWDRETEDLLEQYLDWAQAHGVYAMPNLHKLSLVMDLKDDNARHLEAFLKRFARHPTVVVWKTLDEPQWGQYPIEGIANAYKLIKQWDPDHPCWMNQAPRGTIAEVAEYNKHCNITGVDIYPVSYPRGKHSHLPNKGISVIGDYCKWISESVQGKKPFWMVLQISYSGAVPPHRVVYPTFHQERYMVYQSIINGARGFLFFGGANILEGRDKELGWNWTFWQNVLKPVLSEITSPEMKQVLLAPDSSLKLRAIGTGNLEYTVREVHNDIYILAAKREGQAREVRLEGLPLICNKADVLFEDRSVKIEGGAFSDTFGPNEVHVYRIRK